MDIFLSFIYCLNCWLLLILLTFYSWTSKRLLEKRFFLEHQWNVSTIAFSFYLYYLPGKKKYPLKVSKILKVLKSSSNILTRLFFYYYGRILIILIIILMIIVTSESNCIFKVRKKTTRSISLISYWICSIFYTLWKHTSVVLIFSGLYKNITLVWSRLKLTEGHPLFWFFYCWLWTYFPVSFSVFIVNFEHVMAYLVMTLLMCNSFSILA